jgi:hypothetical protein
LSFLSERSEEYSLSVRHSAVHGHYLVVGIEELSSIICYLKDTEIELDAGRFKMLNVHLYEHSVKIRRNRERCCVLMDRCLEWINDNTTGGWSLATPSVFALYLDFSFEHEEDSCAFALKFT